MNEKIFISIASYRDDQVCPTVDSIIENADYPDNLRFGVLLQNAVTDEDKFRLKKYEKDSRFKIKEIECYLSRGVCWARKRIQDEFFEDEDFYLQIDSHHRFVKGWDSTLLDMYYSLVDEGYKKPIISSYLPKFNPDTYPEGCDTEPYLATYDRFLPEGVIFVKPVYLREKYYLTKPFFGRVISGHFAFTTGSFVRDVPYDPNLFFHGEETSLAARAFTHGYDIFCPNKIVAYHEYGRYGKSRIWNDMPQTEDLNQKSYARYRVLFGMNDDKSIYILPKYGFGTERSLRDFEKYAGVEFKTRRIHKEVFDFNPPPIKGDFESGLLNKIVVYVNVYKGSIKEDDVDFMALSLMDENWNDIYRQDVDNLEYRTLINEDPNDNFIHIRREFFSDKWPVHWRVWPYSLKKGWIDKIEGDIPYM